MICSEFFELLDSYESITDEQKLEMEKHIAECETCRKEFEFFKSVISNLASIPSPEAPKTLIDKVNAKLDAEKTVVVGFRWNFRVLSTVAACLAIGLAVGINNGYIKDAITDNGTDGVISQTVVEDPDTVDAPLEASVATEPEAVEAEPIPKTAEAKPIIKKPAKATRKPAVSATDAPVKTHSPEPAEPETAPTQTVAPASTPGNTQNIENYQIKTDESQIAYGYYNVENNRRIPSAISDYIHVQSDDMGAVVSIMSEMGFRYSSGYYMTSRQNFYNFINRLDDEAVGYDCDLRYNSSDNISFRLTYN